MSRDDSVRKALYKYHEKALQKGGKTSKKRNKKPEKEVEKVCMRWFYDHGFSMNVVEAKAVYNTQAGRYVSGQTDAGFVDSAGCTPTGIGAFVEFKAKGRRSTLSMGQREFLKEKIMRGCFACVVDGFEHLSGLYFSWVSMSDRQDRIQLLMNDLPKKRGKDDESDQGLF